ncbi:hypothetical protein [Pseudoxanthomonas sp. GW2]|uniref:hypothetical protein n=1 Tax=Pseudoxanthomonas sp. GW2 TaxID=1211114 RepID=UPI0002EE8918|nr:hypothetical protein [Pseudoxanthomonas sp. GW2]
MSDRPTPVSIHATSIAAKEAERQRLAADVEAFRQRGNTIEVLTGNTELREDRDFREFAHQLAQRNRKAGRRRASAAPA